MKKALWKTLLENSFAQLSFLKNSILQQLIKIQFGWSRKKIKFPVMNLLRLCRSLCNLMLFLVHLICPTWRSTIEASYVLHVCFASGSLVVVRVFTFSNRFVSHHTETNKYNRYYVFQQTTSHAIILLIFLGSTVSLWAIKYLWSKHIPQ